MAGYPQSQSVLKCQRANKETEGYVLQSRCQNFLVRRNLQGQPVSFMLPTKSNHLKKASSHHAWLLAWNILLPLFNKLKKYLQTKTNLYLLTHEFLPFSSMSPSITVSTLLENKFFQGSNWFLQHPALLISLQCGEQVLIYWKISMFLPPMSRVILAKLLNLSKP